MFSILTKIASLLSCIRKLFVILAIAGLGFIAVSLVNGFNPETEIYLLPSLALTLWCLLAYIIASVFVELPEPITSTQGFFTRVKLRIQRGLYWLLAVVFIALTATTLVLTLRLLNIWRLSL